MNTARAVPERGAATPGRTPAPVNHVRPVDWLLGVYNLALAALWAAAVPTAAVAGSSASSLALVVAHCALATALWWIPRLPDRPGRFVLVLREAYPLLLIPLLWEELDAVIRITHAATNDGLIMALDRALFGLHLDAAWMPAMPQLWFSELMHFSYWIYLPLIFLPPIAMALRRDAFAFQDVTLRLMTAYLACYAVYLVFPTAGPKVFGVPYEGALAEGFFFGLVAQAHEASNVWGAAFPSSHVAGAVTVAWLGWRWFSPGVAILLSIQALGVVLSTVYTQNHYAIDSVVGVVFALSLQAWAVPAIRRFHAAATHGMPASSVGTAALEPVRCRATPPLPHPPLGGGR